MPLNKKFLSEVIVLTKSKDIRDFECWIKWYKQYLKFDNIIVFDNESLVDIKPLCNLYGAEYFRINGYPDQYSLYDKYVNESKAWWVLPVDDDELLYFNDNSSINEFIINNNTLMRKFGKMSFGWLNLFPQNHIETRTQNMIENATAYSHKAVSIWQGDNIVKTIVFTGNKNAVYKNSQYRHNPCVNGVSESILITNEVIKTQKTVKFTEPWDKAFILHYQFKSNEEWKAKCKLGSPGDKFFSPMKQAAADRYTRLYENKNDFKIFNDGVKVWKTLK